MCVVCVVIFLLQLAFIEIREPTAPERGPDRYVHLTCTNCIIRIRSPRLKLKHKHVELLTAVTSQSHEHAARTPIPFKHGTGHEQG